LIQTAQEHVDKLKSHPPNDPNRDHWKKEIKAALSIELGESVEGYAAKPGKGLSS
jgi:hypothetical protein